MSSYSPVIIGTAVVSNIKMEEKAGLKQKLNGLDVKSSKPDEDLMVVSAVRIIPDHESLTSHYILKTNDTVTDILGDLLASGM